MGLDQHYDPERAGGGKWLKEGEHEVTIKSFRVFQYNTGNDGLELGLEDGTGRTGKYALSLHPNSLWKLANFAVACGLDDNQMRAYDPVVQSAHNVLMGRKIGVVVELVPSKNDPDKKYAEVVEFYATNAEPAASTKAAPVQAPDTGAPADEDIPF